MWATMLSTAKHWKNWSRNVQRLDGDSTSSANFAHSICACYSSDCVQLGDYVLMSSQNLLTYFEWPRKCFTPRYGLFTAGKILRHLAGTLFCTIALFPPISPYSLSALFCLLYHYVAAMRSCLLTPFKGFNTKAIGLYAITFDGLYRS